MQYEEIIKKFELLKSPKNIEGMARFGIRPKTKVCGIPIPEVRKMAKAIGKNHELAIKLFDSGVHEARILGSIIAESAKLSEKEIDKIVKSFDSWDIVDQTCMNLFDKSEIAKRKILEFSKKEPEFEKRTAFALIAALASHDKKMQDVDFINFFPLIKKASVDERNFVRKAVNWALRGIGKRNKQLNEKALKLAKEIQNINSKSAKWIANDAIRELSSENVKKRLKNRK